MKPMHFITGLGVALILAVGGWYVYMQKTPPYEEATERGLSPANAKPVTPPVTGASGATTE